MIAPHAATVFVLFAGINPAESLVSHGDYVLALGEGSVLTPIGKRWNLEVGDLSVMSN